MRLKEYLTFLLLVVVLFLPLFITSRMMFHLKIFGPCGIPCRNMENNIKNAMKAAVLTEYNKIEWKDVKMPHCGKGEVLIRIKYGCICGSDQHIFKGEFHPRTKTPL